MGRGGFGLMLIAALAAILGAGAAVLGNLVLAPARRGPVEPSSSATGPPHEDTGLLREELAALGEANLILTQRLARLEERLDRPARRPLPVEAATASESGSAHPKVPDRGESLEPGEPARAEIPPILSDTVYAALQEIRATEEEERETRRQEFLAERVEQRLERLTDEVGLQAYQLEPMREVLTWREARRYDIEEAEEFRDRDLVREEKRALRDETTERLELILLPEQLEALQRFERNRRDGGKSTERGESRSDEKRERTRSAPSGRGPKRSRD